MAVEFDTAVARIQAEVTEQETAFEFVINERDPDTDEILDRVTCHAYQPEEGQVIILMADIMGRRANTGAKIAGIVDFLADILDEESREYIVRRLLDPKDPFGAEELTPIMYWLIEEWTGRPTKRPSDYLPSRKSGGQKSTPRTRKSTSSASRRTAS